MPHFQKAQSTYRETFILQDKIKIVIKCIFLNNKKKLRKHETLSKNMLKEQMSLESLF